MTQNNWRPGFQRVPPGLQKKFGDHMLANLSMTQVTGRVTKAQDKKRASDVEDDTPDEPGDEIFLSFQNGVKKWAFKLTGYNQEELDALRELINIGFDLADPIVKDRDRIAEEAAEHGRDIFVRRHRGAPKLSIFTRSERADPQGVPNRPADVLAGDGSEGSESGGSGGHGGDVAERPTPDHVTEDNGSTPHKYEEPRVRLQTRNPQ